MATAVVSAELVAPVANMLAAAVAAGRLGPSAGQTIEGSVAGGDLAARTSDGPVTDGASAQTSVDGPALAETVVRVEEVEGERAEQGAGHAPGPGRGDLCAAVHVGAGPRAHRVHDAPVRPGRRGGRVGWPAGAVEVIDADLGVSGRSTEGRDGFKALIARVCLGEVGAVFGPEVSRLARSSADLSRLLELARLTDTLVIDADGIYDLADFNDRLLLGLKGP